MDDYLPPDLRAARDGARRLFNWLRTLVECESAELRNRENPLLIRLNRFSFGEQYEDGATCAETGEALKKFLEAFAECRGTIEAVFPEVRKVGRTTECGGIYRDSACGTLLDIATEKLVTPVRRWTHDAEERGEIKDEFEFLRFVAKSFVELARDIPYDRDAWKRLWAEIEGEFRDAATHRSVTGNQARGAAPTVATRDDRVTSQRTCSSYSRDRQGKRQLIWAALQTYHRVHEEDEEKHVHSPLTPAKLTEMLAEKLQISESTVRRCMAELFSAAKGLSAGFKVYTAAFATNPKRGIEMLKDDGSTYIEAVSD